MSSVNKRVAVCSWSLQPRGVDDLIDKTKACGVAAMQLALEPLLEGGEEWSNAAEQIKQAGLGIVSGMMGCVGEDYSTIARIKETGGVMPDATWPATLSQMRKAAPVARSLGLTLVTFHAGFIPHDRASSEFSKGVARVGQVAQVFADEGIAVALETGQEPADALVAFLHALGRKDVGVNFDPANMLLYGSGEPIAALRLLLPSVRQVHIKDAIPSGKPGQWGTEVLAGTGKVDWPAFFEILNRGKYAGHFVVEREAGGRRTEDVVAARELVSRLGVA